MKAYHDYCVYKTIIYALPPLLIGAFLARRQYALAPGPMGFTLGSAAGLIPG
ncbi:MAG: hypothetical protein AB9Q23_06595 [Candidatus Reddybacter sp.]